MAAFQGHADVVSYCSAWRARRRDRQDVGYATVALGADRMGQEASEDGPYHEVVAPLVEAGATVNRTCSNGIWCGGSHNARGVTGKYEAQ